MTEKYDAIVIGAGQGGGPIASELAQAGRRTVLIERAHVGGTCVNEGCTPTKTMVASARVAHLARRAADYGVHTGDISVDMKRVRERKRQIVNDFRTSGEKSAHDKGVDLIMGEARFIGPRTVEVTPNDGGAARQLSAPLVLINTGCRPAAPGLEGIERVATLDSTSIMELDSVPAHLLVLGGGYIGLEFGQMFRRFGSRVTIVQRPKQLLGREDADIAEAVADVLRGDGVDVLLDTAALRVEPRAAGLALTVKTQGGERVIEGSHLLVAAGRTPNTDALNLEAAGVEADKKGFIRVNDRLETNVEGIYALGDVKGGPAFTHVAYDDFRIVRANLLRGEHASTKGRLVPYAVFIDPQLGRVGLSEQEAREEGKRIKVAKLPMSYVARALEVDETRGMMKAIVDADSEQILGFAMLGIEGGEIMSAVQIAMLGKLPYTALRDGVFAHPTLAESLNNLFTNVE